MLTAFLLLACSSPEGLVVHEAPPPGPGPLLVQPSDLIPGQTFTLHITGATPLAPVGVAGSTAGSSPNPTLCPPALNFLCLNLIQPRILAQGQADANGEATLSLQAPANLTVGATLWLQGASAAGRSSKVGFVTSATVLDPACPQILRDFAAETQAVRSCSSPAQCGQVLQGTSCGCTRNWVARTNANTQRFYQLLGDAQGCGMALISTCDCPQTYGFDCVQQICTWDYTP